MKKIRIVAAAAALLWLESGVGAHAADVAAGQKTFESICAACHELKDYSGKTAAVIETQVTGIVAGTIKHKKKLTLSPADITNVAAYISANETK